MSTQTLIIINKMPVFFRGFNLYGQVPLSESLVDEFREVFAGQVVEKMWFTHSLGLFKTKEKLKVYGMEINESQLDLLIKDKQIKHLALNDQRIIMLLKTGQIVKIDLNGNPSMSVVSNINLEEGEEVSRIECGARLFVLYTTNGQFYNDVFTRLKFKNSNIVDIKCGSEHCLILDKTGNVYSFGRGSRGQLGHGRLDDEEEPQLIEALAGLKITKISTGFWHSCAISECGDLYTWGWNGNGQLGLIQASERTDEVAVMATPTLIDFPEEENVLDVACGSKHTVVLLDNNKLYGCGWNKYKQLNNSLTEDLHSFTYLHDFTTESVSGITCGPWNTAVSSH